VKKFAASLNNACRGVRYALATERNIRIHLFIFVLVLVAAIVLNISKIELLLVLLVSALNFSLELANTALERLADKVSPDFNPQIGLVKDVMAGAVLVASLFAILIGLLVFGGPVLKFLQP